MLAYTSLTHSTDTGYTTEKLLTKGYDFHVESIKNIYQGYSPMCVSAKTNQWDSLHKRHKHTATTFHEKESANQLMAKNKNILDTMKKTKLGNYRPCVPKKAVT